MGDARFTVRRLRRPLTGLAGWSLRRWVVVMLAAVGVLVLAAIGAGAWALQELATERAKLVDRIDPAAIEARELTTALINQQSGLRGFELTAQERFLAPYVAGVAQEARATGRIDRLTTTGGALAEVARRATLWREQHAEPTIAAVRASGAPVLAGAPAEKASFDRVRAALATLEGTLGEQREAARVDLGRAASALLWVCVAIAVGVLVVAVVLAAGLRAAAISPLSRLASETRRVTDGDFSHEVRVTGPREVSELADDVEDMRRRILLAVAEVEERSRDLERSNAELEQFAYVASHDLQEPLRKVAGFCELLERRYAGQLDERADQYIGYAVDGAKRMQVLINDLLAFSRVGRVGREQTLVSCDALLAQAKANLALAIEESDVQITADPLPTVLGEAPLLTTVFQNLLGNAVKFRGDAPPRVHVGVRPDGEQWEFCVADNGIGIAPEYAERIFAIFQRLHPKEVYGGTGIGLAMCRKIVEYHGGRIWLDTGAVDGTTFRFTLPVAEESDDRTR